MKNRRIKITSILLALFMITALLGVFTINSGAASETVSYIDASGVEKTVSAETIDLTELAYHTLTSGWYIVTKDGVMSGAEISGDVHLILKDGVTLTVNTGIRVLSGNSITIYGQKNQTGKLLANSLKSQWNAGIGATRESEAGKITINGGEIVATGGSEACAIGGAYWGTGNGSGDITINGGNVTAIASSYTAIGPGDVDSSNCNITINGGTVNATGGENSSAIGAYFNSGVGNITINGGVVVANGGTGIGTGSNTSSTCGKITINGGHVTANGGSGAYVNGRGNDGAGIGGGYLDFVDEIEINGGYVVATSVQASAIGSGMGAIGGNITITGGTIVASTQSTRSAAIGGETSYRDSECKITISGGNISATGKVLIGGKGATVKNANGDDISLVTYTLNGVSDGTKVTDLVGITYNENDLVVENGKIDLYLPAGSVVTKIYVGEKLFCLPDSEGSTSFTLHSVHTASPVYTAHGTNNNKHIATYSCCDEAVVEDHAFNASYVCACGAKAEAKVVTAGNVTTLFTDLYDAAAYAVTQNNSTLTLLSDVDLADGKGLFEGLDNKLSVTLDLNGKTLTSANSATIKWDRFAHIATHHTLTIKDSVGTGQVKNSEWHAIGTDSSLIINGGYFEGCVDKNHQAFAISCNGSGLSYNDTVTINGGTFYANNGISGDQLFYFVINGGSFRGKNSVIHSSYDEGRFIINSATFPEGLTVAQWSEPIATLLAPGVFLRDEDNKIITLTATAKSAKGARSASAGANLQTDGATVTPNTTEYPYTALQHKPTATVVVGGQTLVEGVHYKLTWSNNVNLGTEAVVTATGIGDFSGYAFGTFEIVKGTLKISTAPTATYEFGDTYVGKAITGGKVVIVGNDSAVITGTWTWVDGTDKATFTPDAQYAELFEVLTAEATVSKSVIASVPNLTLTTPSPSIMPGMTIKMGVVAENKYNADITDLPTSFKLTYKIGESGSSTTVSGLEFTLPAGVTIGETVYVTVENVAVSGKYSVGRSNTVEIIVGQVNYSEDIDKLQLALENAVKELEEKIAAQVDPDELAVAIKNVTDILDALDDTYATDSQLADAIAAAEKKVTEAYEKALDEAVKELEEKIAAQVDPDELAAAIKTVTDIVDKLDETYATDDQLSGAIKAAEKKVTEAYEKALDEAVKELEEKIAAQVDPDELAAAIKTVTDIIDKLDDTYATDAALEAAIKNAEDELAAAKQELEKLINDTKTELESDISDTKTELENNINDTKTELENNINDTKTELEDNINNTKTALEQSISALDAAVKAGDNALAAQIAAVSTNLENARVALETADALNKKELKDAIAKAESALQAAIDKVAADLEAAKLDLQSKIDENAKSTADEVARLDKAIADAKAALEEADAANKAALEGALEAAKAELEKELADAKEALQAAIDKVVADLEAAKTELAKSITDGDTALDGKIAELNSALTSARSALEAADIANKTELEGKIDDAYAALDAAIKALQQSLDDAKAALEKADADSKAALEAADKANREALDAKDGELQNFIIIVCVIASVSLCGSGAFVVWFFVDKRKKAKV